MRSRSARAAHGHHVGGAHDGQRARAARRPLRGRSPWSPRPAAPAARARRRPSRRPAASASRRAGRRRTASESAEPTPATAAARHRLGRPSPATSRSAGTAASAPATRRSRSRSSSRSPTAFNASHPGIHLQFEGYRLRSRRATRCRSSSARATARTSSARSASAAPRRSTASGSTSSRSSTRTGFDMSQYPELDRQPLQRRRRGPGRHPVRDLSVGPVLQGRACSRRPVSTSRRTSGTATYTMPDGSTVPWDYDTVRKIAKILTVDKNGKDATEAGFDPENIVQWGFEPQRDDLRQTGAYWKAGTFVAADGKTVQIPEAWAAAWQLFLRRHLEGPHQRRPARSSRTPTSTRTATRSSPARSR